MQVKQIINSVFTSNTYIISNDNDNHIYLIDVGEIKEVLEIISDKKKIKAVFLTHSHFDHIYGINKLIEKFPECVVYCSDFTRESLYSAKLNLSFYHEEPIVFQGSDIEILKENDEIRLFDEIYLKTIETPGHNWGSLCFKIGNYFFTGDSFIPNVEVVTKLKGGNREANKKSLEKIMNTIYDDTILCPGHGEMTGNLNKTNILK